MEKLLFISNITNGITNFCIPSYIACKNMNIEFHLASNLDNFDYDSKRYSDIFLHNIKCERSPFSLKNIKAYKETCKIIRENNITYIHCNTPIGGIIGRLCGKKYKVKKVIYTAHGFHFFKGAPRVSGMIFKMAEHIMAHWTDAIITMNNEDYESSKKMHLKKNGKIYKVSGVGIDTSKFDKVNANKHAILDSLGLTDDNYIYIGIGDLVKNKNFEIVIKAIKEINDKRAHYLICGDGPLKEDLENMSRALGVENQIHLIGYRNDIIELLNISDCFVFMSKREGLPRSTMEAMASGLPCIVSNIRGNCDLIEDNVNGYLVDYDDIQSLSKAIIDVMDNKTKNMGEISKKRIKNFDSKIVQDQIDHIYAAMLERV